MRSEGYSSCRVCQCVCVCVCVCVKSHLNSGASVHHENVATYSTGNEICGVFFEKASAPSFGWPYIRLAIFLVDNMHALFCRYV